MKKIVIIGAGGFAREVAWLIEEINSLNNEWDLLGFIDENLNNKDKILNGCPVLGDFGSIRSHGDIYSICAVGNPKSKSKLVKKAEKAGLKFTNLIHPKALVSRYVEMGLGNIVCAGVIISTNVTIGSHVSINPASTVGHDTIIEDYSTILWSVNISGNCKIEVGSDIGTNTSVIQGVTVGSWSVIGAGAAVIDDIPPDCTAVGIPARAVKFHNPDNTR